MDPTSPFEVLSSEIHDEPSSFDRKRAAENEEKTASEKRPIRRRIQVVRNAPCVDFDQVADSQWGTIPLLDGLSNPEKDRLLGWATNSYGPEHNGSIQDNPLADLPSAPSPYFILHALQRRGELNYIDGVPGLVDKIEGKFDHSSLVALGMVVEDQLTTSLLPLARQHVLRCRRQEEKNNPSAFREWTLPPEEALLKIAMDPNTNMEKLGLKSAMPQLDTNAAAVAAAWCETRKISIPTTRNNMDIFGLFLPATPIEQKAIQTSSSQTDDVCDDRQVDEAQT